MSLHQEHKIAVVGPEDMVSGLRAVGAEVHAAANAEEALQQIEHIRALTVDDSKSVVYAVVCVIEEILDGVDPSTFDRAVAGNLPAVVIIPGPRGSTGQAEARIKRLAEQAVGTALW